VCAGAVRHFGWWPGDGDATDMPAPTTAW
jgi:hypothetical protein